MRKTMTSLAVAASLLLLASGSAMADKYVYAAKTGDKYHTKECRFLKDGKTRMFLKEAKKKGLKPCSVCKPPKN